MAAKPARKEEKRYNADYLAGLLKYLDTAPMQAAIDEYNRLERIPEGDDWLRAELGRQDLFYLLVQLLRRPDVAHPWLYARCREVERDPDGYLDLWSRFHYKSTIITFGATIQDILIDREITIGLFSHTRPTSKAFLRQIKTEFEVNRDLIALYPDVLWDRPEQQATKWSEDEGITVRRDGNPKEATLEAWGLVDGMPTSKHFKLRLYDDVVTKDSVTTPDMMKKTTDAVELSYALGTEDGAERWVGTRYHFNDTYRTIIQRESVKVRKYNGTVDNCGDLKRPVLWSPEFMARMRKKMGLYTFGCQILQDPRADATHGFKREWLERWTPDDGKGTNIYLLRDPASKKKAQNGGDPDYTADWVVGLGEDENIYVLAMFRERLNLTQRTERLFELHRKWKPIEVRYEEYGLQADIEHIEEEQNRQKYRFKITRVGGATPKPDRIKRLIPYFENHRIILPHSFHVTTADHETLDMVHEFVENEYMAFPVPAHDDGLDALSRICDTKGWVGGEKVNLKLKWPAKKRPNPVVPSYGVLDPIAGI